MSHTPINDGGPAFPGVSSQQSESGIVMVTTRFGMSLRDYFAASILQGLCLHGISSAPEHRQDVARAAYNMADAMLKARERTP